jgi:hypothetical protein
MFQSIFGDRAKAYSPEGKGVYDERDIMQKLLEVWGIFQELKHYAREDLPWELEIPKLAMHADPITAFVYQNGQLYFGDYHPEIFEQNNLDPTVPYTCGTVYEDYETGQYEADFFSIDMLTDDPGLEDAAVAELDYNYPGIEKRAGSNTGISLCWYGDKTPATEWVRMGMNPGTTVGLCPFHAEMYWAGTLPDISIHEKMLGEIPPERQPYLVNYKRPKKKVRKEWKKLYGSKTGNVTLPGFRVYSADVYDLAQKAWANLAEQQFTPWIQKLDLDKMEDQEMAQQIRSVTGQFMEMMTTLLKTAPQTYKMFPWLFREYKWAAQKVMQGTIDDSTIMAQGRPHITDIMKQAEDIWKKLRDDPRPEVQVPNIMADFKPQDGLSGFQALENWVYKWREENQPQGSAAGGTPVYELNGGWTIRHLTDPEDLVFEGNAMGHCVGGYCDYVEKGSSIIYSLRDPKGMPHATIEIKGQPSPYAAADRTLPGDSGYQPPLTPTEEPWLVEQIQGKENRYWNLKPEYIGMIRDWFTHLQDNGVKLTRENDDEINDAGDLENFVNTIDHGNTDEYGIRGNPMP